MAHHRAGPVDRPQPRAHFPAAVLARGVRPRPRRLEWLERRVGGGGGGGGGGRGGRRGGGGFGGFGGGSRRTPSRSSTRTCVMRTGCSRGATHGPASRWTAAMCDASSSTS